MRLQPAFGGLQLPCRIAATHQSIKTRQMAFVLALQRSTQHLFRSTFGAQLTQLFGVGEDQLRLLPLRVGQLLPGTLQRLPAGLPVFLTLHGQAQVLAPGTALELGQLLGREYFVLAQLGHQPDQRRPVTPLLIQTLQLPQHLRIVRMTLMHGLQGNQCGIGITAVDLQLRVGQGNRQFGLRLALQGALEQVVAVFGTPQLVGRTGRAKVVQQWLALGFGGAVQMALSTGPATFGQIELTLLDSQSGAAAAVVPRPWIDHAGGDEHQPEQHTQQPHHQHHGHQQGQGRPQGRLVAERIVGDQHIAAVPGHGDTQQGGDDNRHHHQQVGSFHGVASPAFCWAG